MPTSLIPVKYIFVIPVKGIVCAVHIDTLWCQSAQAYPNSGHKKTEIDTLKHKALQHRSANLVLSSGHRGHQRPQNFLSCHLLLEEAYCAGINGQSFQSHVHELRNRKCCRRRLGRHLSSLLEETVECEDREDDKGDVSVQEESSFQTATQ